MFLTYLRRELRRRMRPAIIVAVGLALGIGLVIVVTSVSSGVKNAQASVLHSLYGEGTDITVTKTPTAGTGGAGAVGFRGQTGTPARPPGRHHHRREHAARGWPRLDRLHLGDHGGQAEGGRGRRGWAHADRHQDH